MQRTCSFLALLALLTACDGGDGSALPVGDDATQGRDTALPGADLAAGVDIPTSPRDAALADLATGPDVSAAVDVPAVDAPPPPPPPALLSEKHRTHEIDLGMHELTALGYTGELAFTFPEGYDSFVIVAGGDDGVDFVVTTLQAPDASYLVPRGWDSFDPMMCLACANRVSSAEGVASFLFPGTPEVTLANGQYRFVLRGFVLHIGSSGQGTIAPATGSVRVRVLLKEPLEGTGAALLDLNLHFTGAGDVTAASAPGSDTVSGIVSSLDEIYAAIGVRVGDVRYFDAPSELQVVETTRGADSDLSKLFRASAGHERALNLFFVDRILSEEDPYGGFGVILGIAGGIPGPPLLQGTPRSGVAVVIEMPWGAEDVSVGSVAAHESGHFLGLYHSSEQYIPGYGQIHDQIADTRDNDPNNLMFFTSTGASPALTEGQGFVVRKNPLVYSPSWVEE